ncbi:Septin Spn7 [Schizosaccharomyces pombe]
MNKGPRHRPKFLSKKGKKLRIMVAGSSYTSYQACINSLCSKQILEAETEIDPLKAHIDRILEIREFNADILEDEFHVDLTVIEVNGFGDKIDNSASFEVVTHYLESQFDQALIEESKIKRNSKFTDTRVDALLYFIAPRGHCLSEFDLEAMKRFSKRVNVIPVIGNSNAFTEEELKNFKDVIMKDLKQCNIKVFDFPWDPEEDEDEVIEDNKRLWESVPFAVSGGVSEEDEEGYQRIVKKFQWGTFVIDDPAHSDFLNLKTVLFISHLDILKSITKQTYYENYRTEKLSNGSPSNTSLSLQKQNSIVANEDKRSVNGSERTETRSSIDQSEMRTNVSDSTKSEELKKINSIKVDNTNSLKCDSYGNTKTKTNQLNCEQIGLEVISPKEFPHRTTSSRNSLPNNTTKELEMKKMDDLSHERYENLPFYR